MIALGSDYLLFQTEGGEAVPLSSSNISIELTGDTHGLIDSEFVRQAAKAVFHYFKFELGRQTVSVAEFAEALERVLHGFALQSRPGGPSRALAPGNILESDLCRLADEFGWDSELAFFPKLREELRRQLRASPRVVRFRGLRGCVKRLAGARRWNFRCRDLQEQIVAYLRQCLSAEARQAEFALVVE